MSELDFCFLHFYQDCSDMLLHLIYYTFLCDVVHIGIIVCMIAKGNHIPPLFTINPLQLMHTPRVSMKGGLVGFLRKFDVLFFIERCVTNKHVSQVIAFSLGTFYSSLQLVWQRPLLFVYDQSSNF